VVRSHLKEYERQKIDLKERFKRGLKRRHGRKLKLPETMICDYWNRMS
jgi:hypothetical protein